MRSIFLAVSITILSASVYSQQFSHEQVKSTLIQQSVSSYIGTIGNCPCPYSRDKAAHLCGNRSAWSKSGGNSPLCYPGDITSKMMKDYENNQPSMSVDGRGFEEKSSQGAVLQDGTRNPGKMIEDEDQSEKGGW